MLESPSQQLGDASCTSGAHWSSYPDNTREAEGGEEVFFLVSLVSWCGKDGDGIRTRGPPTAGK